VRTLAPTNYRLFTPEERFRLILAAGGRDDDAERDRLVGASARVARTLPDYFSHAQAFQEVTLHAFLELLQLAGHLLESLAQADAGDPDDDEDDGNLSSGRRLLDLAFVAGFLIKTKMAGWTLFCDRLGVPPFLLWRTFPGHDRLERAHKMAEQVAFEPEGFTAWRCRVRPRDVPAGPESTFTAESEADQLEAAFRERVKWWGG
jgi:hypothetical protein